MRLSRRKFADALGISVRTLLRYEKKGFVEPHRDISGRAYYLPGDVETFLQTEKEGLLND